MKFGPYKLKVLANWPAQLVSAQRETIMNELKKTAFLWEKIKVKYQVATKSSSYYAAFTSTNIQIPS